VHVGAGVPKPGKIVRARVRKRASHDRQAATYVSQRVALPTTGLPLPDAESFCCSRRAVRTCSAASS